MTSHRMMISYDVVEISEYIKQQRFGEENARTFRKWGPSNEQ